MMTCAVVVLVKNQLATTRRPDGTHTRPVVGTRFDKPQNTSEIRSNVVEQLGLWWEQVPEAVQARGFRTGGNSNIHPDDYVGPESCRKCHPKNHRDWSNHPHRRMNGLATSENVMGDFSGGAHIDYFGGTATFEQEDKQFFMRLARGDNRLNYEVTQTIGSRFYQYYVGKLLNATEKLDEFYYREDHVLPFGYWLERQEWVPVVHVTRELPDGQRLDPFRPVSDEAISKQSYSTQCNYCHTTFPLGDMFIRHPSLIGRHAPVKLHWSISSYLSSAHDDLWDSSRDPAALSNQKFAEMMDTIVEFDAPEQAVTLGVSCEACHLGSREHAQNPQRLPEFFPRSPHLHVEAQESGFDFSRNAANVNWACGRCHAGNRPQFAAGMSTWNSTEYTDATRGSCYSKLKCVDCHSPHKAIGQEWALSPDQNDRLCLKCHEKFEPVEQLVAHTHHPAGSSGAHCMNCHMPRINEGLQDVVRTHMIYSPTNREMIEANHPNACNQCHVKESIEWTQKYLNDWYGAEYDPDVVAQNYSDSQDSVVLGWLKSGNESVRLIAADCLARTDSRWALPQLIEALDDPYLLNRQFVLKHLESMLGIRLDKYGYRFFMGPAERRAPLQEIRRALLAGPDG
jgi:predicted CXXCH cytochrome family protein